jgi:pyruvate dehydrogenase E2 component (dihydrolipoyllysine-residue acetyltransferase)
VEALGEGILSSISAAIGDVVPVGQTVAWLLAPGETVPTADVVTPTARRMDTATPLAVTNAGPSPTIAPSASGRRVSPKTRRLAAEHGVDLDSIQGSGAGGEILSEDIFDVVKTWESGSATPPASDAGSVWRLMAERTTAIWTSVPHFFVAREVDASGLLAAREHLREVVERSHGAKLTLTDLFVALAARALRKHPRMNATWARRGIRTNDDINIAIAIATTESVVAPVIHKADTLGLADTTRRELRTP